MERISSPEVDALAKEVTQAILSVTESAAMKAHQMGKNRMDGVYVAAMAAVGTLHVLALLTGNDKDEDGKTVENPISAINPTSLLFAAMLANKIAPGYETEVVKDKVVKGDKEFSALGFRANFGAQTIAEAAEAVERLTGRNPDAHLSRGLMKATREVMAEANAPLDAFMAKRNTTPPTSGSVN